MSGLQRLSPEKLHLWLTFGFGAEGQVLSQRLCSPHFYLSSALLVLQVLTADGEKDAR
jgi:hypothetical protein